MNSALEDVRSHTAVTLDFFVSLFDSITIVCRLPLVYRCMAYSILVLYTHGWGYIFVCPPAGCLTFFYRFPFFFLKATIFFFYLGLLKSRHYVGSMNTYGTIHRFSCVSTYVAFLLCCILCRILLRKRSAWRVESLAFTFNAMPILVAVVVGCVRTLEAPGHNLMSLLCF